MNRKMIAVVLSILLLTTALVYAKEQTKGADRYHELVDPWMNGEIETNELIEGIAAIENALVGEDDTWEKFYWLSRFALLRGQVYHENKNKEASLAELDRSLRLMEDSIAIQENSDSYRIMAEANSFIMSQKGLVHIILNNSKSRKQAQKALELDPQNARAHLIIGQFLTNAPRIAGGNINKGIELLREQTSRSDLIDEDKFLLLLTLSEALERNKQPEAAVAIYLKALRIFPGYRSGPTIVIDLE